MKKKKFEVKKQGYYSAVVMQPTVINEPSENVASEGIICGSKELEKYRDCPDYNTEYCLQRCEFRPKEGNTGADDDILLPDIERE